MLPRTAFAAVLLAAAALPACSSTAPPDGAPADAATDALTLDALDVPPADAPIDARLPPTDLPSSWALAAPGITVEVTREPYRYVVRDASGVALLTSRGNGAGDGYGTVGFTRGTVSFRGSALSGGYFSFSSALEPYRDNWLVTAATATATRLELTLQSRDSADATTLRLVHALRDGAMRVEARYEGASAPRAVSAGFESPASEGFLGFGERFNRTNQRGIDVFNWAEEGGIGAHEGALASATNPGPSGQAMAYYPVPFFVSTRGYAFWLDTTYRSEFNLATQRQDAWRVWHIGPSLAYEVYVPSASDARPWPFQLVDRFTATVGRPMLPPAWAYGPRRRVGAGSMQNGVSEIQAMRDLDLAITAVDDAVHLLPAGSHVGREAALSAWTADARRLGYRVNAYYNSLVSNAPDSPIHAEYQRAVDNNWFLRNNLGQLSEVFLISGNPVTVAQVDFTSPAAVSWYQGLLAWGPALGYSGWMEDFGEYVQPNTAAANGMTGEELHNLYPVLYHRAVFDAMQASPQHDDWLAFSRSGYTGVWQYTPMTWSGDPAASFEDSDGLPSIVRALVNLSATGAPNSGSDIGGFHCVSDGYAAANEELVTRWIEAGSMAPNMQDQNACSGALDMGVKASIWNAPAAQRAWATYARLHTRLFPYLWALGNAAHATGAPIARHVFFEHPDHPEIAALDDEYYLGSGLLVAPVVHRGQTARDVVFPPGLFVDMRDGALYEGGRTTSVAAPLAELPLFLRDGHIIPLLDPRIDTLAEESNPDVVGPADVANVYDVIGALARTHSASFTPQGEPELTARYDADFAPPAGFTMASSAAALADCAGGCWLREARGARVSRVRITAPPGSTVTAGGLVLRAGGTRTIRWDLYLID